MSQYISLRSLLSSIVLYHHSLGLVWDFSFPRVGNVFSIPSILQLSILEHVLNTQVNTVLFKMIVKNMRLYMPSPLVKNWRGYIPPPPGSTPLLVCTIETNINIFSVVVLSFSLAW